MQPRRIASCGLTIALLAATIACGGGNRQNITIAVSPTSATVDVGSATQATATVTNDTADKGVTWTVSCSLASCGSTTPALTSSGSPTTYTPPASQATSVTVTLTATSVSDSSKSAAVPITVPAVTITVSPASPTVQLGGVAQFTATVANDGANKGVAWAVSCAQASCGSISPGTTASGAATTYTAPTAPPAGIMPVTITATSMTDTAAASNATASVPGINVSISPSSNNGVSVPSGGNQQFTATVTGDPSSGGVTWSLEIVINPCGLKVCLQTRPCPAACGSVSPTNTASNIAATYTAPPTPPKGVLATLLVATSMTNTSANGTASIQVLPISVSMSPANTTVAPGATQQFSAAVTNDGANRGVTWSLSQYGAACSPACGTISPTNTASGVASTYTAPTTSPVMPAPQITATSVEDMTKSASATAYISCSPAVTAGPDVRADCLLSQMTQSEEVQLVHGGPEAVIGQGPMGVAVWVEGVPRLNIPNLYMADGSVGLGNNVGQATALPSSIASAATWDPNEAYKYGTVIGKDFSAYAINMNLGGNVNLIGREPRDGRVFESKGEDPILAGKIAAQHLKATQDQYVLANIKHFAFNDQQTGESQANALIDDRSARESDLLAFEVGIKDSGVQSLMCATNLVNGTYSCEDSNLLSNILKGNWAFHGFVLSDALSTHATADANAGLDEEQPVEKYFQHLPQAIANGQVSQARLDNMVHRTLRAMYAAGLFDHPASPHAVDVAGDDAIAQEIEEQGAVLLQNNGILPLAAANLKNIAVIGSHADIGVLSGGGSAQVTPNGGPALNEGTPCPPCWASVIWDPSSPLNAIEAIAPNANVQFNDGTNATSAATLASASDVAIVFVSQWTSEGMDMPNLNFTDVIHALPVDQDALVSAVVAANPKTIVVMENGGAQVLPWLNQVAAVLEAWYPGERGAEAIANILFGAVNPSGKLPITFPASVNDLPRPVIAAPTDPTAPFDVDYTIDGFNVGYKWFDVKNLTPLLPFGFGLSYTTFSFSNAQVTSNLTSANPNIQVSYTITNTGSAAGSEVAQVYLGMPAATGEPPRRLVAWQKTLLQPGQAQTLTIEVDQNDSSHPLSYWDVNSSNWLLANGDYTVYLGSSSRNVVSVGAFHVGP
jgi:beta-glucosidase